MSEKEVQRIVAISLANSILPRLDELEAQMKQLMAEMAALKQGVSLAFKTDIVEGARDGELLNKPKVDVIG